MSGLINKVKEVFTNDDSTTHKSGVPGTKSAIGSGGISGTTDNHSLTGSHSNTTHGISAVSDESLGRHHGGGIDGSHNTAGSHITGTGTHHTGSSGVGSTGTGTGATSLNYDNNSFGGKVANAAENISGGGIHTGGTTTATHGHSTTGNTTGSKIANAAENLTATHGHSGRAEETASHHRSVTGNTGDFTDPHRVGHDPSMAKFDAQGANTHHDLTHLAHVTKEHVSHREIEEVERQKEHERHVHHVQHHVQPILDKEVRAEVHHEKVVPTTTIQEKHVATEQDRNLLSGLVGKHRDEVTHGAKEREIVDLGERVHETVHHHVHNVVQPVIHKEVVDQHRIHTVIPSHHITHEQPIIHSTSEHQPMSKDEFLKQGGQLGSKLNHSSLDVLRDGECERTVDGVDEAKRV